MLAIISKPKIDFEIIEDDLCFKEVAKSLAGVSEHYPDFKNWLYFTFRTGLYINERKILIAHCDGEIAGISLLKKSVIEKKICTFFVLPEYREEGLGRKLMRKSLPILGGDEISISVSEERDSELSPLLRSHGFSLDKEILGHYRASKLEFFYKR